MPRLFVAQAGRRISPLLGETITCLEMTSLLQLVPGRSSPESIALEKVGPDAAALVGSIYRRIGEPLGWTGRSAWSETQWKIELSRPGVSAWVARVGEDVLGLFELEGNSGGDVGIVVFGLVPEFVGREFGGALLTLATQLAWEALPNGETPRRVWVQTSSHDHPHALPNYTRRGFTIFRTESR